MKKNNKKDKNRLIHLKGRGRDCAFCKSKKSPNWRDYEKLAEFLSTRKRILPSQMTGVCMKHQRELARVIKEARELALLPYIAKEE